MHMYKRLLPALLIASTMVFVCKPVDAMKTSTSKIQPSFDKNNITAKQNGTFEMNVFLDSGESAKVSAATVFVKYPSDIVEYVENSSSQPNEECKNSNYKLNQTLGANDDKKQGVLKITKVLIATDDQLPSGNFCFTTLTFKAKSSFWFIIPWFKRSGGIGLADVNNWQIVGPTGVMSVNQSQLPELSVNVVN